MTVICPLCVQTCFSSLDALHHRLIKASNGPLACPICDEVLMGLDKLTIHLFCHSSNRQNELLADKKTMTNRENSATFNCDSASLTMSQIPSLSCQNLETNLALSTTIPSSNQEISSIDNFKNSAWDINENHHSCNGGHINSGISTLDHKCTYCPKVFSSKDLLLQHLKCGHTKEMRLFENITDVNNDESIVFNQLMETDFPLQHFGNKECTRDHNNFINSSQNDCAYNNPGIECKDNYIMFKNSEPDCNSKLWRCNTCSKSFTTKYFLKKHKRLHTGEMPYTCEICARTFTFQQSYHKHLMYHSDEKPHTCSTCGRAFKELSTLHNHERIHSGEKPYKCEVCGKCFRQRVSFLVHSRIHTGVMPYKCEICNKSFRYKVTQRTHKCQLKQVDMNMEDAEQTEISTDLNSEKLTTLNTMNACTAVMTNFTLLNSNLPDEELNVKEIDSSKSLEQKMNDVLNTPPINEMLLSSKDTYLPLLDIQNIHLFSPTDNDSVQSTFSNIFN